MWSITKHAQINGIKIPVFDLSGKVAIVTGGTKGLGYAITTTLAAYGVKVVVASRTESDCVRVTESLNEQGFDTFPFPTDVTDVEKIDVLVNAAVEKYGKLDIMINNAGSAVTKMAVDMTEQDWDQVLNLDLKACMFGAQAAAKEMIRAGNGGRIIHIASMDGLVGARAIAGYCAAKGGLINLTKALALEWGKYSITVNCICPGYFKSEINSYMFKNEKWVNTITKHTAVGRVCELEEITSAVVYLASDYAGYTTGTHILMDGGTTAQ